MESYQTTGRRLRFNHSNALPRYIVAFDTETERRKSENDDSRFSHNFRLATCVYGRLRGDTVTDIKERMFRNRQEWWSFVRSITNPNYTVWIVCHNAIFDMVIAGLTEWHAKSEVVVDWPRSKRQRENNAEDDPHEVGTVILGNPPTIIALRDTFSQGRFVILDTLNYFPGPLADLGAVAGIPKFERPAWEASDAEWFRYCLRDSQIVFSTFTQLISWVKKNDMGMFRYTGPAQAMSAFRHRFMHHPVYFHDNAEIKHIERCGYFGGRTEVFRIGPINQLVHHVDVNALFPSVMATNNYPIKLDCFEVREDYLALLPDVRWSDSIAEVLIKTRDALFPKRTTKAVLYPTGQFTTTLAGPELASAVRRGSVIGVRSWAEYDTAPIFTEWVDVLWRMRSMYRTEKNELYQAFCKLLMNALYGKFAQLGSEWVNDTTVEAPFPFYSWHQLDLTTGQRTEYRSFGWTVQRLQEKRTFKERPILIRGVPGIELVEVCNEQANTFVAISAFVTAYARMRMNTLRSVVGDGNVLYQGVDGLIVTDRGFERLAIADEMGQAELGKLRLIDTVSEGEIFGCSDYRLENKIVISGRAKPALDDATGEYMQRKFAGTQMLFSGNLNASIEETVQPWVRSTEYTKGTTHADGWVAPLVFADGVGSPVP